jgi:hypothetical protein
MAIKIETINQFDGWGNDTPKLPTEYFHSKGFHRSGAGIVSGRLFSSFDTIGTVGRFADGLGRDLTTDVAQRYLFGGDSSNGMIYQSDYGTFPFEAIYRVMGQTWFANGMIVDQKSRLLYSGERYLGMHDSTVANYGTGTVTVTNGAVTVVGSGTTFVAGDVGKVFRLISGTGASSFYKIGAFTDATHIDLTTTYAGATSSGESYRIYRGWTDAWKDWGTTISSIDSPMEIYEDTVLVGRNNNIVTLNTVTDTVTTDTVPAFNMPSGYVCNGISANVGGILMSFNIQNRGTLVLWDNYSDRSIAPWIKLNDEILGITRHLSGWLVLTRKSLYFTNGYSITLFADEFLNSSVSSFLGGKMFVQGEYLYFTIGGSVNKAHGGVYRMNLTTKLCEYYGGTSEVYNTYPNDIIYHPSSTRIYAGGSSVWNLTMSGSDSTKVFSYTTNEIGLGENYKVAEALRIPVGIDTQATSKSNITFTMTAKISDTKRQLFNYGAIVSGTTTSITVDETVYSLAEAGDEIEFLSGVNAGTLCNIVSITGGGTSTAVYALDTTFGTAPSASDAFNLSGFKKIGSKTVTSATEMPDMYFGIKDRIRSKKFMVKLVITGATVPVEIKPFQFIYDDLGGIQ